MSGFVLHPQAYADVNDIWEYIAADNLDAADRIVEEIYGAIKSLVLFPQRGRRRSELTSRPVRFEIHVSSPPYYANAKSSLDVDTSRTAPFRAHACPFFTLTVGTTGRKSGLTMTAIFYPILYTASSALQFTY